ncbi:MAG TPA: hypothetical protein VHW09_07935 [Bryobacteraceae bacterium]|jgi:YVTN family beta-propeller protein|nr:hypothetical protein [Bryobacteraceae bacterium]
MRFSFTRPFVYAGLLALPVAAASVHIYVTNSAGDSMDVIDAKSNKVVQVIPDIEQAQAVDFSADGTRVYVSIESAPVLDVIDRKSGNLIKQVPLSGRPDHISVTKDGKRILVAIARTPGAMDVVDATTLEKIKSIPMQFRLHYVYVTPDGKYAVATSTVGHNAVVINLDTYEKEWEINVGNETRPIAFETNADGSTHRMFVEISDFSGFLVVDFASHKEVGRIHLPDLPEQFGAAEGRLQVPCHGIGTAPDGKTLWVNSTLNNAVFAYSLPDLKLLGHVVLPVLRLAGRAPIGAVPEWLTFTPDSKTVYVSNSGGDSISAIDISAIKTVAIIPVGDIPKRINTLVTR